MASIGTRRPIVELLEERFPNVSWRRPLRMFSGGEWGYECKVCTSFGDRHSVHVPPTYMSVEEFEEHMQRHTRLRARVP